MKKEVLDKLVEKHKLKKAYQESEKKAIEEITKILKEAYFLVEKARSISEKYGVPYHFHTTTVGQNYKPSTFEEMWRQHFNKKELNEMRESSQLVDEFFELDSFYDYIKHLDSTQTYWEYSELC